MEVFCYESHLNYPFKNEVMCIKDLVLSLNDSNELEILMLVAKPSFTLEKYFFSIIFQKSERIFIAGPVFVKTISNHFVKIHKFCSNFSNSLNFLCSVSKTSMHLFSYNNGEFKVNFLIFLNFFRKLDDR